MPIHDHDQETARRYLLGKLTDDEQLDFEQRVLIDDEFAEEFEVTKEELVDDYLANQLTDQESEWLRNHFLSSPQGKQTQEFATTFLRYVSTNQEKQGKSSRLQGLVDFLSFRTAPVQAFGALTLFLLVIGGTLWFLFRSGPPSYVTLTLTNSAATRSTGDNFPSIKLQADILQLILKLPEPRPVGIKYGAEILDERGERKQFEAISQDGQSVIVEIPTSQLPAGQYAIALYAKDADGGTQRIRGTYPFTVEY